MIVTQAQLLFKIDSLLGEGAIWHFENQLLYWVDILGKKANFYDPVKNINVAFDTFKRPGTIVPVDDKIALLALEDGFATIDIGSGQIEYKLQLPEIAENLLRFNDGKCDERGKLWVGTMGLRAEKGAGSLYTLNNKFHLAKQILKTTISNGIAWSLNNSMMYYIDTATSKISCFDYDLTNGSIRNKKDIITIDQSLGYPDGMTIDSEGMLWVALWDGFAVGRFNPHTGEMMHKVIIPAPKITSCAFGGNKLDELFITSASCDMSDADLKKYPLSGSLFRANVGCTGLRANRFKF